MVRYLFVDPVGPDLELDIVLSEENHQCYVLQAQELRGRMERRVRILLDQHCCPKIWIWRTGRRQNSEIGI